MMTFDELERTAYINDDQSTLQIIEVCREHFIDIHDSEITNAYNDGYETGQNEASETNYDEGLADGKKEGYDSGFSDGKSEGHDDGYEAGYAAAMRDNKIPY